MKNTVGLKQNDEKLIKKSKWDKVLRIEVKRRSYIICNIYKI